MNDLRRNLPPRDYDDRPDPGEPDYRNSSKKKGLTVVAAVLITLVGAAFVVAVLTQ